MIVTGVKVGIGHTVVAVKIQGRSYGLGGCGYWYALVSVCWRCMFLFNLVNNKNRNRSSDKIVWIIRQLRLRHRHGSSINYAGRSSM